MTLTKIINMTKNQKKMTAGSKAPPGVVWHFEVGYVDIDTGEVIEKREANDKTKFLKIKFKKNGTLYNQHKTHGWILATWLCRKQPQQQFNFS